MEATALNDKQLTAVLHERGQRVTPQRLVINRALRELDTHVTAEEVLAAVADRLPNVSLPTVYSTLDLFEELGLVHRIGVSQGALLYDPRPQPHDHMVCDNCGKVEDLQGGVELDRALFRAKRGGFRPRRAEVRINGLCADCARLQ
ncbi:MAG TPA: Fur family transcriptional regulator [Thermoleophilaceae bacterium]|jgi:Fe2+ or Zn2+ uptake regulation protein|nr:Fur family transcriptional regulator [Thermoleophilaceae bacterium]